MKTIKHTALVASAVFAFSILQADAAHAAGGLDSVTAVLQKIIDFVVGPFGKAICTLAIMAVAIGWLMGRLEAEKALIVLVAMGVLMAAPSIASLFTGV